MNNILLDTILVIIFSSTSIFAFFKWIGQKWLEERFSKRFEEYKKQKEKELEDFKIQKNHELNFSLSQKNKWQDKEYEVFPILWQEITQSIDYLNKSPLGSFTQAISFPKELHIDNYAKDNNLTTSELQYLKDEYQNNSSPQSMTSAINSIFRNKDLNLAREAVLSLKTLVRNNVIFLQNDLKNKIIEISEKIAQIENTNRINEIFYADDINMRSELAKDKKNNKDKFENEILPLKQEIEDLIQKRLAPQKI